MRARQAILALLFFASLPVSFGAADQDGTEPRRDVYGDPLPPGAIARLGTVRLRHGGWFAGLAFSRDGKTLYTASQEGQVRLWEVGTGRALETFRAADNGLQTLVLSPKGNLLAAGGYHGVVIWDLEKRKPMRTLKAGSVRSLALTRDGKTLVSGGADHSPAIRVWDLATGKERRRMMWHQREVSQLLIAPDNRTLISASMYKVHFADLNTGEEIRSMADADSNDALLTRDGKQLILTGSRYRREAKAFEGFVEIYDIGSGQRLRTLSGLDRASIRGVAVTADGNTLITSEYHGIVRVWDLAAQKELRRWHAHVTVRQLSPDGKTLAVTTRGGNPLLLDSFTGKPLHDFEGHTGNVSSVAFSPDGKLLASSSFDEDVVRVWDVAKMKKLWVLRGHKDEHPVYIRAVAFLPDGNVVSGASDSTLRLWDPKTGTEIRKFQLHGRQQVMSLGQSGDGKLLLCGSTGFGGPGNSSHLLTVFDAASAKELSRRELKGEHWRLDVAFSPDGKAIVQRDGKDLVLREREGDHVLARFRAPDILDEPFVFSPDGKLLAVRSSTPRREDLRGWRDSFKVRIFETATGNEKHAFAAAGWYGPLAFSRDSRLLAVAGDKDIHIRDLATGKELWRSPELDSRVGSLDFAPDGSTLASGLNNSAILIWDVTASAKERKKMP